MKLLTYKYLLELKIINGKTMCMPIRKTYLLNIPIHTRHTWSFHWFNVDDEAFTNFLLKDAEHDIYNIKAAYGRIKWAVKLIIDILKTKTFGKNIPQQIIDNIKIIYRSYKNNIL